MLSHVKSGAIYHNYSISPNISSSFFDFSSLSLSFRRFYAPIQQHCPVANEHIPTTLPTRSGAAATVMADAHRPTLTSIPSDVNASVGRCRCEYCPMRMAISRLQSRRRAWRAERRRMAEWAGGGPDCPRRQTAVCHGYWRVGIRLCYPVSVPLARLSTAFGAIETISGVLIYIKNTIIL